MKRKIPHEFQLRQATLAPGAPGPRWLFADEMGLGKTGQAILASKQIEADQILVIAPALARRGWKRELGLWWPEQWEDPNTIAEIDMNPERKSQTKKRRGTWEEVLTRPARIVSPELLNAARERAWLDKARRPVVVLDEAHMYADPKAKRSKEMMRLLRRYKGALWGATATPIPNRVIGAWNLFNMIWPRRFGVGTKGKVAYEFAFRYVERIYSQYGSVPGGLAEEYKSELQERFKWMMSRTTKNEVPGVTPPCQLRPLVVGPDVKPKNVISDWVTNAAQEAKHVAILTHYRRTARSLAKRVGRMAGGIRVVHMDGGTTAGRRAELLDELREAPRGILVSTMHAVARAISLSFCTRGLLAELYWSPEKLVQVVGRFSRMDSDKETVLDVMCGADSVQERIAFSVSDKLWDNQQLLAQGAAEAGLAEVLGGSEEDLEQQLLEAALCVATDSELEALELMGEEN